LIFRGVHARDVNLRGDAFLSVNGYLSLPVSAIVSVLLAQTDPSASTALRKFLKVKQLSPAAERSVLV
jgi:hypothetical protein